MDINFILYSLGRLLLVLSLSLLGPAALAYFDLWPMPLLHMLTDGRFAGFILAMGISLIGSLALTSVPQAVVRTNSLREGFAIVTFGWVLFAAIGAIPLFTWLMRELPWSPAGIARAYTDAFFEVMSGFTTTGATILPDVEIAPRSILLWRAVTHWLGGMGIVTLVLAVFPAFGVAGYQMFKGEMPGPTKERLRPRLAQTAKVLWGVYALLTGIEIVLLWAGGMSLFEAVCHSFATMATGGFSTRNASIGAFSSIYIECVVTAFMFIAGINFMLHYVVLFFGRFSTVVHDPELRFYVRVLAISAVCIAAIVWLWGIADISTAQRSFRNASLSDSTMQERLAGESAKVLTPLGAFRYAAFQVVSITTTTGFCTADFDVWPAPARIALVVLMFFGGCAGSTAGGIKMIRMLILLKGTAREIRREIEPRAIIPVKITRRPVDNKLVADILGYFVIFMLLFILFSVLMTFFVADVTTAVTAVAATMCNVGPGLSGVGATETYAWIPLGGKWMLSLCMLLGRLEIFTVLIALSPISWKR